MLQIKDLSIYMKNDGRPLVERLTINLNSNDKVAVIGEEGNGKSTLLRAIYDVESISDYAVCEGAVFKKRCIIGYLPQLLEDKYLNRKLGEYFTLFHVTDAKNAGQYARLLTELGLEVGKEDYARLLSTFSGGEKIKIQLLSILLSSPDVLLLDEPTNDIDIDTLVWLETFINTCRIPVMYVSHDEMLIENTANVILHMEMHKRKSECSHTISRLSYSEYIKVRKYNLEKQDQIATMQRAEYAKQMERWKKIHDKVEKDQENISRQDPASGRLLKKKMKSVKSQEKRFMREKEDFTEFSDAEEAIFLRFYDGQYINTSKRVLDMELDYLKIGDKVLSADVKLYVKGGEHIGIYGKNGAGKTTLLRQILNHIVQDNNIRLGYMPQDYTDSMDNSLTCIEFLAPSGTKADITKARQYMGGMKFTADEMIGPISGLSGGQKAKLYLLKIVLDGCNVLVMDEPTRNLSPLSNPVIREQLKGFKGTIIAVSHDRKFLNEVCDKRYELTDKGFFRTDMTW
ncbi:MAG TPA: ATP-binding cassette domain-containing protein [Clostridia bacterium]|jgi:ATPase subunit of ABC transporter with duplicated ATPase domains|nr:ABC-F family ATP-binding cassette domain-containing protein [Clostridiaceae bacterium]HOM35106.1 ATP-binding cassette domain-containing protein [Clostridia bacterium]HOT70929.1 ATP-binding cassette domain-containing protein [Clostridia bacterium]HQG00879.1 ATP-binding cassette domain-containing protein [Clostridia bacterium]HQH66043.1 ATP-binding cassette domain-containing protein [Clostridia bacterium]